MVTAKKKGIKKSPTKKTSTVTASAEKKRHGGNSHLRGRKPSAKKARKA